MSESNMNYVDRYRAYKKVLERPTFDSIEDAQENMRAYKTTSAMALVVGFV